ncbi:hypothetical protein BY996DRAFT_6765223 [Phakopsora pachyrhizi]|nr:hypothetical protein BY996DRAFT_6765223 [Phakopsora pachyrhizi]
MFYLSLVVVKVSRFLSLVKNLLCFVCLRSSSSSSSSERKKERRKEEEKNVRNNELISYNLLKPRLSKMINNRQKIRD